LGENSLHQKEEPVLTNEEGYKIKISELVNPNDHLIIMSKNEYMDVFLPMKENSNSKNISNDSNNQDKENTNKTQKNEK
jgi:hypothetical protein